MRLRAMGLPMIPSPTKPTFSAILSLLLKLEISDAHLAAAHPFGDPREAVLGSVGGGVVLQAHVPVVADLLERAEDKSVVDLARPRLPAAGRVRHLYVPDGARVLAQVRHQVPLHPLHVVEVVLDLDVLAADALYELHGVFGGVQQIRAVLEDRKSVV